MESACTRQHRVETMGKTDGIAKAQGCGSLESCKWQREAECVEFLGPIQSAQELGCCVSSLYLKFPGAMCSPTDYAHFSLLLALKGSCIIL